MTRACPQCGRESTLVVAGYDMAVVQSSDEAEYCIVSEGVEGRHIHVHRTGGRWKDQETNS